MDIQCLLDGLCDYCIRWMRYASDVSDISYGTLNVLLFIILGPLSTLFAMISAIIGLGKFDKYKYARVIQILSFGVSVIIVIGVLTYLAATLFGLFITEDMMRHPAGL